MKAVILTAGRGTRLYPVTKAVNKNFLPLFNKPLIYYPLSLAAMVGIREVIFVVDPMSRSLFERALGDGQQWGMNFSYVVQSKPRGLAEGLILSEPLLESQPVMYILGDNVLYGPQVLPRLREAKDQVLQQGGAVIFGYPVADPHRFGVVEFNDQGQVLNVVEKPAEPRSQYAIVGVYFFDSQACALARQVEPSARGELEITSVLEFYLKQNQLHVRTFGTGTAWFDAGTWESLLEASLFVAQVERHVGEGIGYIEEWAWRQGWIDRQKLLQRAEEMKNSSYSRYLHRLATGGQVFRQISSMP